jgi:hypothetical protein
MLVGELPNQLRRIVDDGRSNEEIIRSLESKSVTVFHKDVFVRDAEPIPLPGTTYNFLAVLCRDLPGQVRRNAERIFSAITRERHDLRKPTLRSALLLMERMACERLYAETVVMNDPVASHNGTPVLICLGREDDCGQSWVAAVGTDYSFPHDNELVVVLAEPVLKGGWRN